MIDKNLLKLGFASSNAGLIEDVVLEVKEAKPSWNDKKVLKEAQKILKKGTLYNDHNKKVKKPKKPKKVKKPEKVKPEKTVKAKK